MTFNMDNYNDVPSRIAEFAKKHPEGSLQQVRVEFVDFAGGSWIVYTAAAMRSPEDKAPGHGTAWEPVPGKTPYTKDSELQNAETSAWGRAIVAALAADTRKGIASTEEVRNRQDPEPPYQVVPDVGKAVQRLDAVTDADELVRLAGIARGYYTTKAWTGKDMERFNAAADAAHARLEAKLL